MRAAYGTGSVKRSQQFYVFNPDRFLIESDSLLTLTDFDRRLNLTRATKSRLPLYTPPAYPSNPSPCLLYSPAICCNLLQPSRRLGLISLSACWSGCLQRCSWLLPPSALRLRSLRMYTPHLVGRHEIHLTSQSLFFFFTLILLFLFSASEETSIYRKPPIYKRHG